MASHPFSLSVLPIQQALAHFREKKTEAGKESNFPEATQLKRVEKTQDLSLDLGWVPGGLTSDTAPGSSVAGGTEIAGGEAWSVPMCLSVPLSPVCVIGWSLSLLGKGLSSSKSKKRTGHHSSVSSSVRVDLPCRVERGQPMKSKTQEQQLTCNNIISLAAPSFSLSGAFP